MYNQITLIGHVAAEPEMRKTVDGRVVANVRVAVNIGDQPAQYYSCALFDDKALHAQRALHQGDRVTVIGQLRPHLYTRGDGTQGMALDVLVSYFASPRKGVG